MSVIKRKWENFTLYSTFKVLIDAKSLNFDGVLRKIPQTDLNGNTDSVFVLWKYENK